MDDPLKPSASLLCKLGSIIVHVDEANSPGGHPWDVIAMRQVMDDTEVKEWLDSMDKLGMLPVMRERSGRR